MKQLTILDVERYNHFTKDVALCYVKARGSWPGSDPVSKALREANFRARVSLLREEIETYIEIQFEEVKGRKY